MADSPAPRPGSEPGMPPDPAAPTTPVARNSATRRRGPKPLLRREEVLDAALELVDADGLAALNLRRLSARLGVSAMTPYSHFADKAALLSAMVEYALAPLAPPDTGTGWEATVDTAMHELHRQLERHPGVLELVIAESEGEALDRLRRPLLRALTSAGLGRRDATAALRTLTSYVAGYTLLSRAGTRRGGDTFDAGLALIMSSLRSRLSPGGTPLASRRRWLPWDPR